MQLKFQSSILDLTQPVVMGILNITPDSQCMIGRTLNTDQAVRHALQMLADGASIIDIGAESTNPGVHPITETTIEMQRLLPVLSRLRQEIDAPISVDTSKAEVMQEALSLGADMINDVRALRSENSLACVAAADVPVCLMHMAYPDGIHSQTAVDDACSDDVITMVKAFLQQRIDACIKAGIRRDNIILDPGIGHGNFGKDLEQNLLLIKNLAELKSFALPILVGISRKTFIGEALNLPIAERLPGSLAATALAVAHGANIIRTHDVKATVEAVKLANMIERV